MSFQTLAARLTYDGGFTPNERIQKQKYRSFLAALENDYQSRLIKTPNKRAMKALINNSNIKSDYDKKIISVDFNSELEQGDVFEILDDHSHWMIYLPVLTETAYLRSEIVRCDYTLEVDGEEYWVYLQGPTETDLRWYIKQDTNYNELNLSGTIYIKKTPATKKFFKRFTHIMIDGHKWEVQVTDSLTLPGIIELEIQEYYDNTPEDLPVIKRESQEVENSRIIWGVTEVKQDTIVGYEVNPLYYKPDTEWKILDNDRVEINKIYKDGRMCKVKINDGAIRHFFVQYGNEEPLEVTINIEEPYIKGPQTVYPYDVNTYWVEVETEKDIVSTSLDDNEFSITFSIDSPLAKVTQIDNTSAKVEVLSGRKGEFVLHGVTSTGEEYDLPIKIESF